MNLVSDKNYTNATNSVWLWGVELKYQMLAFDESCTVHHIIFNIIFHQLWCNLCAFGNSTVNTDQIHLIGGEIAHFTLEKGKTNWTGFIWLCVR